MIILDYEIILKFESEYNLDEYLEIKTELEKLISNLIDNVNTIDNNDLKIDEISFSADIEISEKAEVLIYIDLNLKDKAVNINEKRAKLHYQVSEILESGLTNFSTVCGKATSVEINGDNNIKPENSPISYLEKIDNVAKQISKETHYVDKNGNYVTNYNYTDMHINPLIDESKDFNYSKDSYHSDLNQYLIKKYENKPNSDKEADKLNNYKTLMNKYIKQISPEPIKNIMHDPDINQGKQKKILKKENPKKDKPIKQDDNSIDTKFNEFKIKFSQITNYHNKTIQIHKYRKENKKAFIDPIFEIQDLNIIYDDIKSNPYQPRAIFLENSDLNDDIIYIYNQEIKYKNNDKAKFKSKIQETIKKNPLHNLSDKTGNEYLEYLNVDYDIKSKENSKFIALELRDLIDKIYNKQLNIKSYKELLNYIQEETAYLNELEDKEKLLKQLFKLLDKSVKKTDKSILHLFAKVENEENFVKQIIDKGAKLKNNKLKNIPNYSSSHKLEAGHKYELTTKDYILEYIPKEILTKKIVKEIKHIFTIKQPDYNELNNIAKNFLKHQDYINNRYLKVVSNNETHYIDVNIIKTLIYNIGGQLYNYNNLEAGREFNFQEFDKMDIKQVTGLDIDINEVKFSKPTKQEIDKDILKTVKTFYNYIKEYDTYELETTSAYNIVMNKIKNDLKLEIKNLPHHQLVVSDLIAHSLKSLKLDRDEVKEVVKDIEQKTIISERGELKIKLLNSDYNKIIEELNKEILNTKLEKEIAYNTIYTNRTHKRGLVNHYNIDYLLGQELEIPGNKMLIHGLTGIKYNTTSIISRLNKIQQYGGLKSIQERRRVGIKVKSLSPIGDMASGIDMGVPCKIGYKPTFGASAYFVIKPYVLARRNMFFAPLDYGGGHNRQNSFQTYAKEIGQEDLYKECPSQAREKHISKNLGSSNEVYVHGDISLDDIDSIIVEERLFKQVNNLIKTWKNQGLPGGDIKVRKKYLETEMIELQIKARSKEYSQDLIENLKKDI